MGLPPSQPFRGDLSLLLGAREVTAYLARGLTRPVFFATLQVFLLVLLRMILRRKWAAVVAFVGLLVLAQSLDAQSDWVVVVSLLLRISIGASIMIRFGLLALVAMGTGDLLHMMLLTTDTSLWYAGRSWFGVLVIVALAIYAFRISLAGRPVIANELLGEEAG